jgi:CheY-like chemotaxis protein
METHPDAGLPRVAEFQAGDRPPGIARLGGQPSSTKPAPPAAAVRPLEGVRVLVVDDNADQLDILRDLLGHAGARVETARTAQEAFDAIQAALPDVLVSDLEMPHATGYALIRRIRATAKGKDLPALAMTAYFEDEHREKALAAGFTAWLSKPAMDSIVSVVARLANRR